MDLPQFTRFLMWCMILNTGFLLLWTVAFRSMPDFIYRQQRKWFGIAREAFDATNYQLLGIFKMLVIVFNVVPYLALLIVRNF